jgi:ArsR family transcriptional regulator
VAAQRPNESVSACAQGATPSCCPLPAGVAPLPAEGQFASAADEAAAAEAERLAAAAKAFADPIRLRMLGLMAAAQCCRGPSAGPAGPGEAAGGPASPPAGVCVCELQNLYGLAQSKVSYHLKVLREAGLVHETKRGKWSFYALNEGAARDLLAQLGAQLGV